MPEGNNNINLAALWVPVMADTSHLGSQLKHAGVEMNEEFSKAFVGAGGIDDIGKSMRTALVGAVKTPEVEYALRDYNKLYLQYANAVKKAAAEEANLSKLRASGITDAKQLLPHIAALNLAHSETNRLLKASDAAYEKYQEAQKNSGKAASNLGLQLHKTNSAAAGLFGTFAAFAASHIDERFGELSRKTSELGSKFAEAGAEAGGVGAAITAGAAVAVAGLATVSAAAAGVGVELFDIGRVWDGVQKNLSFNTGLAGDQLTAAMEAISGVSKTTPVDAVKIGGVSGEVIRSLHLTGEELATVTKQVIELQDKAGQQVNLQELGVAIRALGVDAKDVPALLDQLYTAYTQTDIPIEKQIEVLAKGGALLRQYGLDAGQSAALLEQFDKAGLDIGKSVPVLARSFKESAIQGESFPKFLQESITKIKSLVEAGKQAQAAGLANDVFGASAKGGGASILTAIQNGKLDVSGLEAQANAPMQSIIGNAEKSMTLGEKLQVLWNNVEESAKPYAESLYSHVSDFAGKAAEYAQQHAPSIAADLGHASDNLMHAFGNMEHAFSNTEHAFGNVWHAAGNVEHAFGNVWHAAENIGHALGNIMHATGLDVAFTTAGKLFADTAGILWNVFGTAIKATADWVGTLWHTAEDFVHSKVFDDIRQGFVLAGREVLGFANFMSNIPGRIMDGIGDLGGKIAEKLGHIFDGIHLPSFLGGGHATGGLIEGHADGGLIKYFAQGGPNGTDIVPAWLTPGEFVVNARATKQFLPLLRKINYFETGGEVGPDVAVAASLAGTPYDRGSRNDCSGLVGRVISQALGQPAGALPTTENMEEWLAARNFVPGPGGPGQIRVGWKRINGANDGHAAMTLSNGTNAEEGGSHNTFVVGAGAAGADDPQFDHHMYLPQMYGEGRGGSSGGGGGGGVPAGSTPGAGPGGQSGYYTPNQKSIDDSTDRSDKAQRHAERAEAHEAEVNGKGTATEQDKKRAHDETLDAQAELARANRDLADAKRGQFHELKQGHGKGEAGGDSKYSGMAQQLGSGFLKGIGEEFGFGDLFGKSPLDWGIVKLFEGLGNWGIGTANAVGDQSGGGAGGGGFGMPTGGGGAGAGGLASGLGQAALNATGMNNLSSLVASNAGWGGGGGTVPLRPSSGVAEAARSVPATAMTGGFGGQPGSVSIDHSINITGSQIADQKQILDQAMQARNASAARSSFGGLPAGMHG